MSVKILLTVLFIVNLVYITKSATRIYKRSYDIYDRENWDTNHHHCDGLIIPQHVVGIITSKKLALKQLVLGTDMTFFFNENTDIVFDENSNDPMNCVELNSTIMKPHYWNDIDSWITEGKEINEAVPHIERLPCEHDDVIFPKGILTGRVFIDNGAVIKSLKFGTEQWTNNDFLEHDQDPLLKETLTEESGDLEIRNVACYDESGCECGNKMSYINYCDYIHLQEIYDCLDPIEALGFCNKICGASITFSPSETFKIDEIEKRLNTYTTDTHVSKILNDEGKHVIQVIFTEKTFTGYSLEEAKEFHQDLMKEKIIYNQNSAFRMSGNYLQRDSTSRTVVPLVFGTLIAACFVFGLIFFVFGKEQRLGNLRERFGMGTGPLSYRSVFFSRNLSVSEGAGLIFDGHSVAGSNPNIPKSFDNPMFTELAKKSPSTSESSDSSAEDEKEAEGREMDGKMKPGVFEDQERRDLIETVAEEGELVDLSEMN